MSDKVTSSRSEQFDVGEDSGSSPASGTTMGEVIATRFSRRELFRGTLAATALVASATPLAVGAATGAGAQVAVTTPSFDFKELKAGADDKAHVAEGYVIDVLIRWGDQIYPDASPFDPRRQSPAAQARQFGYNNDFLGYLPLNGSSEHGLLVVNHEFTDEELMFPGIGRQDTTKFARMTRDLAEIEMMAHGGSVIEIRKRDGKWSVVPASRYNRRITAATEMRISGPAAGHPLLATKADPTGTRVLGMLNNCAGGVTPWGTWLTCEENINGYFSGSTAGSAHEKGLKRYGIPSRWFNWGDYQDRFNIEKEPNEAHRFGWVVEIDPFEPQSVPVKRTALGRFKHEGAGNVVNGDGRFVVYSGDDERFEYVYKFVTDGRLGSDGRPRDPDFLDKGTLFVARFNSDGTGEWLPLVHGQGPLATAGGFKDQGEVLIHARLAADVLGATRMDRPEDIEVSQRTGKVYVVLTNNNRRTERQVDAANPRSDNRFGHIIEITPDNGDHALARFRWEMLVKCGNPADPRVGASFNPTTTIDGWFGMPDNAFADAAGRLWIATDGNSPQATGREDGIWAIETEGPARGTSKHFFRGPSGAEICGPMMTPDMTTFFVAVQHPGQGSTYDRPSTRWPDFRNDMPPRPSIVAITRKGGRRIG